MGETEDTDALGLCVNRSVLDVAMGCSKPFWGKETRKL